jgi:hypothetical protein
MNFFDFASSIQSQRRRPLSPGFFFAPPDGAAPGDAGSSSARDERLGANEGLIVQLEQLESSLTASMNELDTSEVEIDRLRAEYEGLNNSMALLFGELCIE